MKAFETRYFGCHIRCLNVVKSVPVLVATDCSVLKAARKVEIPQHQQLDRPEQFCPSLGRTREPGPMTSPPKVNKRAHTYFQMETRDAHSQLTPWLVTCYAES